MTDATLTQDVSRRDFLYVAPAGMLGVAALHAAWPLVDQMNPSADVLSATAPLTVDLTAIAPGQQVIFKWRAMPIFVVRRTEALVEDLKSPSLLAQLRDPQSEAIQQPSYARNWSRSVHAEFLVLVGVCTHLQCIPAFSPERGSLLAATPGGYLCHCHGSKYDLAGRVFKGVPAPLNLPVPPHHFPDGNTLVIGENPAGETFDLSQVQQL